MKYLKLFEEFDGFVELSYIYGNLKQYIMVDIFKDQIVDIYTDKGHDVGIGEWRPGNNALFVHLEREYWAEMLEELLDSPSSFLVPIMDDEGDDDEEYNKFQEEMEEVIKTQIPILAAESKYNL